MQPIAQTNRVLPTVATGKELMIYMKNELYSAAKSAANEVIEKAGLHDGAILVVGCSSSEIAGSKIGTDSDEDTAASVFGGIYDAAREHGVYLAAQCCEHLNRAIIIETELREKLGIPAVWVVPKKKAGGSFATAAWHAFENPCAVEHIKADAGMDIGDTLIGMHLKEVAVPLRISVKSIGSANLVCAYTRPKYIGGPRAMYE